MLPIVDEEIYKSIIDDALEDINSFRKRMIHYIKNDNPEINSAIIDLAQKAGLDAKAVATGAYITYLLLEKASEQSEEYTKFEE